MSQENSGADVAGLTSRLADLLSDLCLTIEGKQPPQVQGKRDSDWDWKSRIAHWVVHKRGILSIRHLGAILREGGTSRCPPQIRNIPGMDGILLRSYRSPQKRDKIKH